MMWLHKCNTFLHHLLNNKDKARFKIKNVDEDEVDDEDEEIYQHKMVPQINQTWKDVTNAHNEEGSLLYVAHIDDFYIFYWI